MLGFSSNLYPLAVEDLLVLPDATTIEPLPDDKVIICIKRDARDVLLRGRDYLLAQQKLGHEYIPTRVMFVPSIPLWRIFTMLIRVFRNHYRYRSSNIYHTTACAMRSLGIERAQRSLANPQQRKNVDRTKSMQKLAESLRRDGFRDDHPISVYICRSKGSTDSLRQGHHRLAACIELGVERIATTFVAAGFAPWRKFHH